MLFKDFERVLKTFADDDSEAIVDNGEFLVYIRGKPVQGRLKSDPSTGITVIHEEEESLATQWVFRYLAKLDRLADRIIDYIRPPENYVSPKIHLRDWNNQPNQVFSADNSTTRLRDCLTNFHGGVTSISFLTSDAGEGKTSLIEKISVEQAHAFKANKTGTLILPVALGGRSFLRFDAVVIASLMNRLRFSYLYYDSFIELIKLNAIIPAFDGFEEVLVDVNSNEAVSALGHLVNELSSSGTILVAARKAYFDRSLDSQSKLLDSISSDQNVALQRYDLERWDQSVFCKYAIKRGIRSPDSLYNQVKNGLGGNESHSVLTRAVLVRRLIDVAQNENDLNKFLLRLGESQVNYFFDFIETIIEREANEKWINRSGNTPLLTIDQHHELLSIIASEMWISAVDALGSDVIQLVIEFFISEKNKNNDEERQIARRIETHALFREDDSQGLTRYGRIRFDHEDFQEFYLGQALARSLCSRDRSNVRLILDANSLTQPVILEATRYILAQNQITIDDIWNDLKQLLKGERRVSYIRENCGMLMLELAQRTQNPYSINEINFPPNALQQRNLSKLRIYHSLFSSTTLENTKIGGCSFIDCEFSELIFNNVQSHKIYDTVFENCTFNSVSIDSDTEDDLRKYYTPSKVLALLTSKGLDLRSSTNLDANNQHSVSDEMDNDMKTALKVIRLFSRSTTITDKVIQQRLVKQSNYFMSQILPKLIKAGLIEVNHQSNKSYRLMVPLSEIDRLVDISGSIFEEFIQHAQALKRSQPLAPH
ncbi:MAG: hypothetical protein OXE59_11035 [Bacteroidetes bacterium]|nr:hypothetical protein [Bacteroidota bacterium]MCY4234257.1 hypothetical protein [Bacteroidota bacterium]